MIDQANTGLTFRESGLAHALTEQVLRVPVNQRAYAWTGDEVETLLDDLYRAFSAADPIYFLGAIVLTPDDQGLQIADGQQRLATVAIIIAAVRDYLLELDDELGADKYQADYLLDYDVRSKTQRPKLKLNFEDHEYFLEMVLKRRSQSEGYNGRIFPSHKLIAAAAETAFTHVRTITAGFPVNERAERLYDWVEFLDASAKVIVIVVPGRVGNAFKMFETLNGRGVEASQTDILKNFLFEKAQEKMSDIHTRWLSMVSQIEDLGQDGLLLKYIRHFWISLNGPTTEAELGEKIEAAVRSERQSVDMVMALDASSRDYVALLTPREHPRWSEFRIDARDCLHTTTVELRAVQIRPLILAITKNFQAVEARKSFEHCLSWSVRFLIAGGGGGGVLDRHYGMRAMEISKKEITTADQLRERMSDLIPSDSVFQRAFTIATVRVGHLARYYLRALDLHIKGESKPQFVPSEDTAAVNLEHILPVTLSEGWDIQPEVAATSYRRLGNMVLLGAVDNVKVANNSFSEKRPVYKESPFELTKMVASYETWGPDEIEKQQSEMAKLAPTVWPV